MTRAALHEQLLADDFDDVRAVVQNLAQEFDIADVAAAAVKLAQTLQGEEDTREIPSVGLAKPHRAEAPVKRRGPHASAADRGSTREGRARRAGSDRVTRLFIGLGRQAGVTPGDLVGAITGEAGISSREIGAIELADRFALVEVPESLADTIITALRTSTI